MIHSKSSSSNQPQPQNLDTDSGQKAVPVLSESSSHTPANAISCIQGDETIANLSKDGEIDNVATASSQTVSESISHTKPLPIDLRKSVRQHHLESRLDNRPTRDDLVQRNILRSHFTPVFANQASELERRIKEARVNQSLLKRPELHELIERNIQMNTNLSPSLRSKASDLEMKVKKSMMEQTLSARLTPCEIRSLHPGVYNSLSEEAKHGSTPTESKAMKKVYVSFLEKTCEQLLISGKISTEQYNQLSACVREDGEQCTELLNAVKEFNETRNMEEYEMKILQVLH